MTDQPLPAGLWGKSNHHLADLSTWQFHKLSQILLLLIRLSTKDTKNQEYIRKTALLSVNF